MNDLYKLLPKVKTVDYKTPEEKYRDTQGLLREYFKTFHARRRKKPASELRYTLFMEPAPYLSVYRDGDEQLPMKKEFYTSFRVAKNRWLHAISNWRKEVIAQRKATFLK